jgi:hypothetical protein
VRRQNTSGAAAPRWYQVKLTGAGFSPSTQQGTTWDPDANNTVHRFMPSLAVNRNGDMALGYSASSAATKPALKYAGRLAADPANTFSQTEQVLIQGAGTQVGQNRWGDYSAMTLDPDGCRFWYTNEYYKVDGLNWWTRIGAFQFPGCTPVGNGTLSGTVTAGCNGAAIAGAAVALGSRSTTTNAFGVYSFVVPSGTYPSLTVGKSGFTTATATSVAVADGVTTTRNVALASTTACATSLAVGSASGTFGGTVALSATLTAGSVGVADRSVSFTLNGAAAGSGMTNASGIASVPAASLAGIDAGSYPTGPPSRATADT